MQPQDNASRARDMMTKLDAVLRNVPGAREAFPELVALHEGLRTQGLVALDALPPMDRSEVFSKLRRLVPAFGARQIAAMTDVLTSFDRRSPQRRTRRKGISTPAMFAAEIPLEEFLAATQPRQP